jgi:hypothetical protein
VEEGEEGGGSECLMGWFEIGLGDCDVVLPERVVMR